MLDGVFNHVGVGHPRFQSALAGNDPAAEALFRIHSTEAAALLGIQRIISINADLDVYR